MAVTFNAADRVGVIGGYIGGIGQILSMLGGGVAQPAANNNGNHGCGCGSCSDNTPVSRYEQRQGETISRLQSENAMLLADTGETQRVFDRMLEDSRVGSLISLRKDQALLMEGSLTDGGDGAVDGACRRHLGFNTFFNLNNILLNAIPYGISAVEVLWSRRDGLLVPSGFVPIPMKALSFPGRGAMRDYMTPVLSGQQIFLDNPDKFLVHRNDTGNGDRWGTPVLKQVYWPWRFKTFGFDAWIFAAKKIGVPTILALFETRGEEESRRRAAGLVEALSQWEAGSNGAMGNVKDVKVISSSIQDFNTLIETCNAEIAYGITGQSLATNQAQYGTRAQSDTHSGILRSVVTKDAYLLQQTNQQLVDAFCRLNFPGRPVPTYDIDSTDTADWATVREAIDRGIPVSRTALYEKLRLPRPRDEGDSFVKEAEGFGFDDSFFLPSR